MASKGTKADDILETAESLARTGGYHGFSFRDIAAEVGIKSASVHYHFPTKADLCAAVARRYTERFLEALGDPADPKTAPGRLLARYAAAFRESLVEDQQMCLCGVFGAEVALLPAPVAAEVQGFFERNVEWLQVVLARDGPVDEAQSRRRALTVLAALEGAMIVARTLRRVEIFDEIVEGAIPPVSPPQATG
jgi:TetR/AcrR family transcriptional repressor of nem operon